MIFVFIKFRQAERMIEKYGLCKIIFKNTFARRH